VGEPHIGGQHGIARRSWRRSYPIIPTVPCAPAATAGSKAYARTPGSVKPLQVRPRRPEKCRSRPRPARRCLKGDVTGAERSPMRRLHANTPPQ
jgi:hypothetical protein